MATAEQYILLEKCREVENHHGDDDNPTDDGPEDVEPLIVFFLAKEKHNDEKLVTTNQKLVS